MFLSMAFVCSLRTRKGRVKLLSSQDLSPSWEPSPSLDTDEPCLTKCRTSSGSISSDRWTVNDDFPFAPKPNLRFRPEPTCQHNRLL